MTTVRPTKNGIEPITSKAATINPHSAIGIGFAAITRSDVVAFQRDLPTYTYSRDFDNNGILNSVDLNFLLAHLNHDCATPLNP